MRVGISAEGSRSAKEGVSRLLCKRPGLFLGMGSGEGGNSPSPARRCRSRRFHCVILSSAGIRSGHRIMKWFKASRQR